MRTGVRTRFFSISSSARLVTSVSLLGVLSARCAVPTVTVASPVMNGQHARGAATLHTGIRDGAPGVRSSSSSSSSAPRPPSSGVRDNFGEHVEVKRDARGAGRSAPASDARQGQSFNDMLAIFDEMTSSRPNRCPDNLDITNRLIDQLQLRERMSRMRFVHVAGTKGKGTTAAYTAALLQGYGFKVGLFTSPHLIDVRERILVDSRMLSRDTFARYFFELYGRYRALRDSDSERTRDAASRANYFRFLFLLSLYIYGEENVDVAVMEVGIGGRIDATNVVPSEVSIITSLGYDHMDILGDTVEAIAREKAGIMKPDTLCLAAPQLDHPETRKVLEEAARATRTPLIILDKDVMPVRSWPRLAIGGDHAVEDSKLALTAARQVASIPPALPLDEAERAILESMTFTGRSQVMPIDGGRDITLYLDGAHTPESLAHATRWFLSASKDATADATPRRVLLFYTSREPQRVLKAFMPFVSAFCKVVVAQVNNPKMSATSASKDDAEGRAWQMREEAVRVTESWRAMYREVVCLPCGSPFGALEELIELVVPAAADGEDASKPAQVFVTGSLYLVGDILKLVQRYTEDNRPPSD